MPKENIIGTEIVKTRPQEIRDTICEYCSIPIYVCDICQGYLTQEFSSTIYCDTSFPVMKHYCSDCGEQLLEDKKKILKEATQDGNDYGIPPKPKDLGILPTIKGA